MSAPAVGPPRPLGPQRTTPVRAEQHPRRFSHGVAFLVALALVGTAACGYLGGDAETAGPATTGGPRGTAAALTTVPAAARPPYTLPGGFPAPASLEPVRTTLTEIGKVEGPTAFTSRPGYPNYYITERKGRVRQLTVDQQFDRDGKLMRTGLYIERGYVLDIAREVSTDGERGMLGLAFSTDGRTIYVSYTDRDGRIKVSSWRIFDYAVDYSSRKDILTIDHPRTERNGGTLAVGDDGFLYIGTGDGGGEGDPDNNAQNTKSLLGKILRIDPQGGLGDMPYGVPPGNPFRDGTNGAPEVWAYGLANPWGFRFDLVTGDLWVPDVAALSIEEVTKLPRDGNGAAGRGANMGWNALQGNGVTEGKTTPAGAVPPAFEYAHFGGECGIIGAGMYRGLAMPGLAGAFVYGDLCTGQIRGVLTDGVAVFDQRDLGASLPPNQLAGWGQTDDGELWVLAADGRILRLDPA